MPQKRRAVRHLRLGLSYPHRPEHYRAALEAAGAAAGVAVESPLLSGPDAHRPDQVATNLEALAGCMALVLVGGKDVAPERYRIATDEIPNLDPDPARDEAEWALLSEATGRGLPVLAICRGCQLLNVFHGGTLIPDLEDARYSTHRRHDDGAERYHEVRLALGSRIARIAGRPAGRVNSSHHQAVERLAPPFVAVAWSSDDGLIEAYEWAEPVGKPPLLAVQWHPERMATAIPKNPLGLELLAAFLREIAAL